MKTDFEKALEIYNNELSADEIKQKMSEVRGSFTFYFSEPIHYKDRLTTQLFESFTFSLTKTTINDHIKQLKIWFGDSVESKITHIKRYPSLELFLDFRDDTN